MANLLGDHSTKAMLALLCHTSLPGAQYLILIGVLAFLKAGWNVQPWVARVGF